MKKVVITLVQGDQKLSFSADIETNTLSEISGTLAGRIIALMVKSRKYKMNLGFSFSRKFDVQISIDGKETDGTNTILNGLVSFGITLGLNEGSVNRFESFISELVVDLLTGRNVLEGELSEILEVNNIVLN